jgi:hypothetical protein
VGQIQPTNMWRFHDNGGVALILNGQGASDRDRPHDPARGRHPVKAGRCKGISAGRETRRRVPSSPLGVDACPDVSYVFDSVRP